MRQPWLVTGATGRIGSILVRQLVGEGHRIRALCLPGDERALTLEGMGAEVVIGDLTDPVAIGDAVGGVAGVFHLGAALTTRGADPSSIVRSIAIGTVNVLEAIRHAGVSEVPFLLVSSTSVYYDVTVPPPTRLITESTTPRPSTPYGAAKHSAELATRAASCAGLIEGVIVRPSDTAVPEELMEANGVFGRRWFVSGALRWYRENPEGTFGRLDDVAYSRLVAARAPLYVRRDEHGHEAHIQISDATAVSAALMTSMDLRAGGEPSVMNLAAGRVWPIRSVVERIADRLQLRSNDIVTVTSEHCQRQWLFGSEGGLVGGDAVAGL